MLVRGVVGISGESGILDVTALSGLCKRPELASFVKRALQTRGERPGLKLLRVTRGNW